MNRFPLIGLLFFLAGSVAHGADDTWNNISHSLARFGDNVRNTFTEDADERPSPTPRRHSKPNSTHSSSKKTKAKSSGSSKEKSEASDNDTVTPKPSPEPSAGANTCSRGRRVRFEEQAGKRRANGYHQAGSAS